MWHFKKSMGSKIENDEGYTLLELLVVLVILTLIIGVAAPAVLEQLGSSKEKTAEIEMRRLVTDLEFFFVDVGRFPSADEGLGALVSGTDIDGWDGPYVTNNTGLQDPWGTAYAYEISGSSITITTYGPDGASGGGDDNSVSRDGSGL